MKYKIGDTVKWTRNAQGRMKAWYLFSKREGPKPHAFTGTIVANYRTKLNFTHGYFMVDFGDGLCEAVFGEDLEIAG